MKKSTKTIIVCASSLLLLSGGVACSTLVNNKPIAVYAAEEEVKEPEIVKEEKDFVSKIKLAWETYLLPVVSGVSIASVLSAGVSIALAIINRRTNTKNRKDIVDTTALALKVIEYASNIISEMQTANKIADETKKMFVSSSKELLEKVALLTGKTEDLQKLQPVLVALVQLQGKIALNTKEIIKSGIGQDIKELTTMVKKL